MIRREYFSGLELILNIECWDWPNSCTLYYLLLADYSLFHVISEFRELSKYSCLKVMVSVVRHLSLRFPRNLDVSIRFLFFIWRTERLCSGKITSLQVFGNDNNSLRVKSLFCWVNCKNWICSHWAKPISRKEYSKLIQWWEFPQTQII